MRSNGDHMHHLGNYDKTKPTQSIQGATKKVIPCRILQNFKQRLKIFGWNLRTLQFLAFLAEREKRARFTYERARKRLVSRLRV